MCKKKGNKNCMEAMKSRVLIYHNRDPTFLLISFPFLLISLFFFLLVNHDQMFSMRLNPNVVLMFSITSLKRKLPLHCIQWIASVASHPMIMMHRKEKNITTICVV